jgi:septal ring factor EnvC (AmiA/AmiB activator)
MFTFCICYSLAGLSDEVTTQKAELKIVDDKVTKTEANVAKLDVTVKKQEVEINTVKQDIKDTNVKVSQSATRSLNLILKSKKLITR